jgi:endonuclease/exonuclease/phosphatase (EEP) superfamily protein YafD
MQETSPNSAPPIVPGSNSISRLVRKTHDLFQAGVFLAVAGSVAGYFGDRHMFFDLLSHFRLIYAAAIGVGIVAALGMRMRRLAVVWCLGFVANAAAVVPLLFPAAEPKAAANQPMRVMFVNVFRGNDLKAAVIDVVRESDPDLLIAVEVDHEWVSSLREALAERWPHHVEEDRGDNFGIVLFSKSPLKEHEIFESPGTYVPTIRAVAQRPGGDVAIYGTHPFPPVSPVNQSNWVRHMDDLATRIARETSPVIVLGDFNSTPWSANYRRFMSRTGLADTMQGFGPQASWPSWLPYLGIPIDHVVVSPTIRTTDRRIGPRVGSDHRPVIADLMIP